MQMYTLSHLYSSTNGPTWSKADRWLEGDPCGSDGGSAWSGLQCINGHVSSIDLSDNSLIGTLPSELVGLSYLQALDLSHNAISGTIPTQIGNFASLTDSLQLYDTRMSGTVPSQLGNLRQLQGSLNLFWSRFSGTLPTQLSQLSPNECALSSTVMPTNHYVCPLPPEIEQWACLTQCVEEDQATAIASTTSQHLYAMMSQSRLDALPLVHSENLLPALSMPPPPPLANNENEPNSQPSGGAQESSSVNSAEDANDSVALSTTGTTVASEGTSSDNRSGIQGET